MFDAPGVQRLPELRIKVVDEPIEPDLKINHSAPGCVSRLAGFLADVVIFSESPLCGIQNRMEKIFRCILNQRKKSTYGVNTRLSHRVTPPKNTDFYFVLVLNELGLGLKQPLTGGLVVGEGFDAQPLIFGIAAKHVADAEDVGIRVGDHRPTAVPVCFDLPEMLGQGAELFCGRGVLGIPGIEQDFNR